MRFANRVEAGRRLAAHLQKLRGENVVVLALPRGGVPVAAEVARSLDAPLDVILVRKLGVPQQPELAMGAIGEGGVRVLNAEVIRLVGIREDQIAAVESRERAELDRRARRYRAGRDRVSLAGRIALVVDDGIATGSTARAACRVARVLGAKRVVMAAPVAPQGVDERFRGDADEIVVVDTPGGFLGIGQFYDDFSQTSDEEVVAALSRAAVAGVDDEIEIISGPSRLAGHLMIPQRAPGIVLFAHGSGSSRNSPRNRYVASVLNDAGLGTLLFDLLTTREELDRTNVFDIDLLAGRLALATRWRRELPKVAGLKIGYFGASTGAGAALVAAATPDAGVAAVVSRGGRPDLAAPHLGDVRAPTLLIVGGRDHTVIALNRMAQAQMRYDCRLEIVPGATHLFEEPGALERAAELARDWFVSHLTERHAAA